MGIDALKRSRAVFLDRDGVINRNVLNPASGAWESPLLPEQFEMIPGAVPAMRRLLDAGFLLFVVSNQPNYAKGKASLETLQAIHDRLLDILNQSGIHISAFYYCLHHPEGVVPAYSGHCHCRKPLPFFLYQARDAFDLEMSHSWMVGDRIADIQCGRAAGTRTIRIFNEGEGNLANSDQVKTDFLVSGLAAAAEIILMSNGGNLQN